jgi:hypothetical protein
MPMLTTCCCAMKKAYQMNSLNSDVFWIQTMALMQVMSSLYILLGNNVVIAYGVVFAVVVIVFFICDCC